MKAVHILSNQPHPISPALFEFGKCEVCGIRRFRRNQFTPPVVPLPHEPRITFESFRRCEIFRTIGPPQAVLTTKGWHAAVCGDAGTGQYGNRAGRGEMCTSETNLVVERHGEWRALYTT